MDCCSVISPGWCIWFLHALLGFVIGGGLALLAVHSVSCFLQEQIQAVGEVLHNKRTSVINIIQFTK